MWSTDGGQTWGRHTDVAAYGSLILCARSRLATPHYELITPDDDHDPIIAPDHHLPTYLYL